MTDTVATTPAPVAASPAAKKSPAKKKLSASKVKKTKKTVALHPTTAVMVTSAIKELKEKKGSSLPAIKKYLAANYKVDPAKLAPFIRKFLKAAVANGQAEKSRCGQKEEIHRQKSQSRRNTEEEEARNRQETRGGRTSSQKSEKGRCNQTQGDYTEEGRSQGEEAGRCQAQSRKTPIKKTAAPKKK
ncbi:unnamed protein product [Macrosiphum euphorbiae]|uniref:H15 domain-containing protein n=1 Tax=Macrosiphum euphorbiae TaxID=13131 RepID=A0AAV0XD51_9HEMI|nr:unnamed protein product [Macrosiphum euphorbiae]